MQSKDCVRTKEKLCNLQHAQQRDAIERTFGIIKSRFEILSNSSDFNIRTQAQTKDAGAKKEKDKEESSVKWGTEGHTYCPFFLVLALLARFVLRWSMSKSELVPQPSRSET